MDKNELLELVPRHKFDFERADALTALGFTAVVPVLPEILVWMQDGNWPIARQIGALVISGGAVSAPFLRTILRGDDGMWKYFVISSIIRDVPALAAVLRPELTRIATSPTVEEMECEVHGEATGVLAALEASGITEVSKARYLCVANAPKGG